MFDFLPVPPKGLLSSLGSSDSGKNSIIYLFLLLQNRNKEIVFPRLVKNFKHFIIKKKIKIFIKQFWTFIEN